MIWFWACTASQNYDFGPEPSQPITEEEEIDADGDGYPSWSSTQDIEYADCDDNDPMITPQTERWIPAGHFWRGDDDAPLVGPKREIYLSDYCMDVYEVRNDVFAEFMEEMRAEGMENVQEDGLALYDFEDDDDIYEPTIEDSLAGFRSVMGRGDHPVTEVWHWSAVRFCAHYDKFLPTEAQWEKGARGSDNRRYPWGNDDANCSLANFGTPQGRCEGDTMPVGSYPAGSSPYGLLDMSGNVSEWVWDYFDEEYYASSPQEDPLGPDTGFFVDETGQSFVARIARSGNHSTDEGSLQVFHRTPEPAEGSSNGLGFRCMRQLIE